VGLLYVGEKKEEEAQYMPEARSVEVCFGAQKQKKHTPPRISLFTSLFDSFCAFVCASELVCFFPFFRLFSSLSNSKFLLFKTQNPPKARLG
jgi:hypothetical protein